LQAIKIADQTFHGRRVWWPQKVAVQARNPGYSGAWLLMKIKNHPEFIDFIALR